MELITPVRLGGEIGPQPLDPMQGVRHGLDPPGIHRIHLRHQVQDLGQVPGIAIYLLMGDGESRQMGDLFDVFAA